MIMKLRNLFLTALCALAITAGFTSCSDDDDYDDSWKEGSKIELPQYRAFVLSEGSYGYNNSHLFYFNPETDTPFESDIYEYQNDKKLGDTANDMIEEDGYIYIVVNHSKRLVKLNGSGVELASYSFDDTLGEPRYIVEEDGKLYVTCYGGYVARFDANTLAYEAKVAVDANPEEIIGHDGYLYCVNSGYGSGHTMSRIKTGTFDVSESLEIPSNSFGLQEDDGYMYIMSYDAYYNSYVSLYDIKTGTYEKIADATCMYADDDKLYIANAVSPDWISYTTTYSVYDAKTGSTSDWNLTDAPDEVYSSVIYTIERNPYDDSFYIVTTDYYTDSQVYHFSKTGKYIGSFSAGGINANSMVFLR